MIFKILRDIKKYHVIILVLLKKVLNADNETNIKILEFKNQDREVIASYLENLESFIEAINRDDSIEYIRFEETYEDLWDLRVKLIKESVIQTENFEKEKVTINFKNKMQETLENEFENIFGNQEEKLVALERIESIFATLSDCFIIFGEDYQILEKMLNIFVKNESRIDEECKADYLKTKNGFLNIKEMTENLNEKFTENMLRYKNKFIGDVKRCTRIDNKREFLNEFIKKTRK